MKTKGEKVIEISKLDFRWSGECERILEKIRALGAGRALEYVVVEETEGEVTKFIMALRYHLREKYKLGLRAQTTKNGKVITLRLAIKSKRGIKKNKK